ncbi:crotonobetaine/carnitine-CoA ligase [Edwardsiella piscicida]|uniref:crotonobetaine/carnitine-CoA ligase n=1 Tax=Edwardsiella piscicida TaxID=1263550 RepID=UPI00054CCF94|nr:crotonobetaine/carnitine-CoA ligase [Edwardsiella piscicida]ELM3659343.1 crotonobetaine/carnitine-CoA ligase [Edwardsiella piscicida]QBB13131.1 crotonobetaine/carnitine-CoA ligase [Edwardsiella piscicida]UCQ37148.1 crotonobetaine/carnitine-CoA ligase [Edwardsiella piscicida]
MDMIGERHLRQAWDDLAAMHGEKTALIVENLRGEASSYSYARLNEEINRTANLFLTLGIEKGDRVALHLNNCAEFIFCWFGLAKIGAVVVPVNANLLHDECAFIIRQCAARLVVTTAAAAPAYASLRREVDAPLQGILLIDVGASPAADVDGIKDFQRLKAQQPAQLLHAPALSALDTAEILFTSGTTSAPKGVVITHYNLLFAGYYTAWQCALRADDVYLTPMPAYHIDCQCTVAMAAFSVGATLVLLEKYSARAFWGQVCRYRATLTECIPLMIKTLMMQPVMPWERSHCLREVLFYLNLSTEEKEAFLQRFGVRLLTSYGMTETIVGLIGDRPGDKRRWPSIGRVGIGYEAEIRSVDGHPLSVGETGELWVRGIPGKTLFKEYYGLPQETARVLTPDGWLRTGDYAYCDDEGYFYFVERSCNMIKRCGENISCVEIENILATHPKIMDVAVVGLKDSIRDEAIKAVVVLNPGEQLSEEAFFAFCSARMAKFKVPSFLEIRDSLPRSCSGKVIKKSLC